MRIIRLSKVVFAADKLEKDFYNLDNESDLRKNIERAIRDIQVNAFCGIQIPKRLFQKSTFRNMGLQTFGNMICLMAEWFDHSNYERRLRY